MEVSGQIYALAALSEGKHPQYPLDRRLGGVQCQSERYGEEKNLTPAGNQTPAVQLVASSYTDRAIPALVCHVII
jgi:hypothetical protein